VGTGEIAVGEKVLEAFSRLKQANSSYELKRINDRYYVYLSFGVKDDKLGRFRKASIYQGKITEDGIFIEKKRRYRSKNNTAEDTPPANPSQSTGERKNAPTAPEVKDEQNLSKYEKTLLTALSMNGRISLPALSKMLGLSVTATYWHLKNLEKRYGIKYIPEIDVEKFGYMPFLFTLKFHGGIPPLGKLREVMASEPRVQLAMLTKGEFDLLIYVLVKGAGDTNSLIVSLCDKLISHDCVFSTIPVYEDYGFVPVRGEFIDLLKENGALLDREYAVLKEFNSDASIEFSRIDEQYGFDRGRSSYSYYKLKNEGKIKRTTITMQKLPLRYIGIIHESFVSWSKFKARRHASLGNIITGSDKKPINKYIAVYDTTSPWGSMFFLPVFGNDDLNETVEEIAKLELGVGLSTTMASNVLVGDFCYRRFDNMHSAQQRILEKEYGVQTALKIDYEETGRKRAGKRIQVDARGAKVAKETTVDFSLASL
jgi:DNA-binding Lrp family transcriptional regulator